ncbi:MAG: hypothetical protein KC419_15705 [Anaerolineales bacterium]|nr:hypothetical protein [Anaerolineales bacterium]MCA9929929.1 hypothetical protein [Anaerolineales bacterium]
MMTQLTTSWMWPVDGGINALRIDPDRKTMKWFDSIECACSDDDLSVTQSVAEFRADGAPHNIQMVPDDVLVEIGETLQVLV